MDPTGELTGPETARFEVAVTPDKMQVHLSVWRLPEDQSADALVAAILDALREAGVAKGIDEGAVRKAVESVMSTGEPSHGVVVAEGQPVVDGADAHLSLRFLLGGKDPAVIAKERAAGIVDEEALTKSLVRAGDTLAVVEAARAGVDGFTVTGEVLAAKPPATVSVETGPGVAVLEDGLTYVVAPDTIGYAEYVDGTLKVEPIVRVAEDGMVARLDVHPPTAAGVSLEPADVLGRLDGLGIVHGVRHESIAAALDQARETGAPVHDVIVAEGTPPKRGEDARIEFLFRREPLIGWTNEDDARIDYRERGFFQTVRQGDLLARKIPATPGECGRDIYGKEIAAIPGQDIALETTGNTELSENGLECRATADGVVIAVGSKKIGVFQECTIPGDVDLHTGNLEMKGVLVIQGWVRAGFKVRASGDLLIGGGIEVSDVKTDGNLTVKCGIVGGDQVEVGSGGALTAQFIENARVWSGGDVTVRDGILNSRVTAEGRVSATDGKGRIIGGMVRAAKGIEVNELGSRAGLRTVVDVGLDSATRARIAAMERDCALFERNRQKILKTLAALALKSKSGKLQAKEAQTLAKLVHYRRDIERKRRDIESYWKRLEGTAATIKVRRAVYDGVVVWIKGWRMHVQEDLLQPGEFVLDVEEGRVVYRT